MKREIVFRGKRVDNGEWIEGGVCIGDNCAHIVRQITQHIKRDDYECYAAEVEIETLSQFTGLIDKNGRRIFENDVIDGLIVSYCGDTDAGLGMQTGWYLQRDDFESFAPLESNLTDVVSGNIFDNPELAAEDD